MITQFSDLNIEQYIDIKTATENYSLFNLTKVVVYFCNTRAVLTFYPARLLVLPNDLW